MTSNSKLRRQIAYQAAVLMYQRQESEYYRAKLKAARSVCKGRVKPKDLPSNAEIRDEIQQLARMLEGDRRTANLREMRIEALRVMRILQRYRPRLIGSVLTGHIRQGSDIDLHLFSDSVEAVTAELDYHGFVYDTEYKRVVKQGERNIYKHVHIQDRFPIELTIYPTDKVSYVFKSSITGKPIERASLAELVPVLEQAYPDIDLESAVAAASESVDRFQVYCSLMLPLENVKQDPRYHPEGDALYHSLQVFDHACDELPYDEEFLTAALLHDVGKAIDRYDHVGAGLEALEGLVTERTFWLIEHHMEAHKIFDRTIGSRAHRRLRENESYQELVLLGECDRAGRVSGAVTTELEAAIDYLREIGDSFAV
ncbi:MAG: HD domain-containing protein [Planctomycetota bacterium]